MLSTLIQTGLNIQEVVEKSKQKLKKNVDVEKPIDYYRFFYVNQIMILRYNSRCSEF